MTASNIDLRATVPPSSAGRRLDQVAAELFANYSRSLLSRWIDEGTLRVDGQVAKSKTRLRGGESLSLQAELLPTQDWASAQDVPFVVLYEDNDILVINKPAGVVVHPGAGHPDGTLVNGLLGWRASLAALPRAGIVHRLDQHTSGVMVVAANHPAHHALVDAIAERRVERRYRAVVEGCLVAGGSYDGPIARHVKDRTRQQVREDGKPALTHVRIGQRFRAHTELLVELATGRTHQIRVHLSHAGYPLLGDRRYGARGILPSSPSQALRECVQGFKRQALHAQELSFTHPMSGKPLTFTAPQPEDLMVLLQLLRADTEVCP